MTALPSDEEIRPNPRAAYRKLADGSGGVVLHLDSAAYHGVNEMGAEIWTLLQPGITVGALLDRLRGQLDEVPPNFEDEVRAFLAGLADRDLILVGVVPTA